ncbi:hypothetical protein HJ590_13315 [Naumannella sp. ID2617S]|nr:hypothetical protein [Naumannella sp. ID2617S]
MSIEVPGGFTPITQALKDRWNTRHMLSNGTVSVPEAVHDLQSRLREAAEALGEIMSKPRAATSDAILDEVIGAVGAVGNALAVCELQARVRSGELAVREELGHHVVVDPAHPDVQPLRLN